jgi:hypothetical protein
LRGGGFLFALIKNIFECKYVRLEQKRLYIFLKKFDNKIRNTKIMNYDQPQAEPQKPEEDLFEWAQKQNKPELQSKPQKDDLGWDCPQCELNGGWCARHPRSKSDQDFSIRVAEHESKIQEAEEGFKKPVTQEELDAFFEETRKKLAS